MTEAEIARRLGPRVRADLERIAAATEMGQSAGYRGEKLWSAELVESYNPTWRNGHLWVRCTDLGHAVVAELAKQEGES